MPAVTSMLAVTDRLFWRADQGDRCRIDALYRHLATHVRLDLLFLGTLSDEDRRLLRERHPAMTLHPSPPGPDQTRLIRGTWLQRAGRRLTGKPPLRREPALAEFRSPDVIRACRAARAAANPDAVMVHFIRLAYTLEAFAPDAAGRPLRLIDTIDVMSDRHRAFQAAGERHWVRLAEDEEARALEAFDVILGIQDEDTARFRQMVPGRTALTVGHAGRVVEHPPHRAPVCEILFVGAAGTPNLRALRDFLEHVWPRLQARFGDAIHLNVVGGVTERISREPMPRGVTLHGAVDDVSAIYAQTDIVVNPVAFGGGLKIKNVEALCHGMPLITTSAGAAGLRAGAGRAFLIGDTPEALGDHVIALVADPTRRDALRREALAFARIHHSEAAAYGLLVAWLAAGGPGR